MRVFPPLPAGLLYYHYAEPFQLEAGAVLPALTIAYQTWGQPDAKRVVWVCHALTGNSDAADWWSGLIGVGKTFDPVTDYIVCANVLGSCYGTTGPLSVNPETGAPYYATFPEVTVRDMARAHALLRKHLGIEHIDVLIGGSIGGQQVLEWVLLEPERIRRIVPIATNAQHSPWGVAFNAAQRLALEADTTFREPRPDAGAKGLAAARAMGMVSYRHYDTYQATQVRAANELPSDAEAVFRADSYLRYQGKKLADRFNAHAYWTLSRAMDSHDVGRNRGGVASALATIQQPALVVSISSDVLFIPAEQKLLAESIPHAQFAEIDSIYGHDGFLVEFEKLAAILSDFLAAN